MIHLERFDTLTDKKVFYIIDCGSLFDKHTNEFENIQDAVDYMFNNYYVDINPAENPNMKTIHVKHYTYGKDIEIRKITEEKAESKKFLEALNYFKIKAEEKKYNL